MLFRAWYRYKSLTKADIRNPDSKNLHYYHQLIRMIPSVFLLSNGIRQDNDLEILFLPSEFKSSKLLFKVEFSGKKLRYLSPDWLSSGSLLVKAFKKYEKQSNKEKPKEKLFVNPGVSLSVLNDKELIDFDFSSLVFVEGSFFDLDKFSQFLNTFKLNELPRLDFVSNSIFPVFPKKEIIFIESFSQTITIINFSIDIHSNHEGI